MSGAPYAPREIECLYDVYKVTEWRDGCVWKTEPTDTQVWLTREEYHERLQTTLPEVLAAAGGVDSVRPRARPAQKEGQT
jgi:hypothetical protein